jgi:hypothetical protein
MTMNMKRFRVNTLDGAWDEDLDDSDASDLEGESPGAIKKRHRRELERAERENRENTSALLELRDLEDELTTLQKLFEMQESTIRQMKDIYTTHFRESTRNGQDYLDEALEYLEDYKQQTSEMLKRVETTRNDVCLVPLCYLFDHLLTPWTLVRENARNGPAASAGRRSALVASPSRARV